MWSDHNVADFTVCHQKMLYPRTAHPSSWPLFCFFSVESKQAAWTPSSSCIDHVHAQPGVFKPGMMLQTRMGGEQNNHTVSNHTPLFFDFYILEKYFQRVKYFLLFEDTCIFKYWRTLLKCLRNFLYTKSHIGNLLHCFKLHNCYHTILS